jgi:hypothetical protein
MATTITNGVLVYVTQGPKGMKRCKHWVPLARVYIKTGSGFSVFDANDVKWATVDGGRANHWLAPFFLHGGASSMIALDPNRASPAC